jgi:surfactin synthase thioesterase subunit
MRGTLMSRRRRPRRRGLPIALILIGIALVAAAVWGFRVRDPLAALPAPNHDLRADRDSATLTTGRLIQHFVLRAADAGNSTIGEIGIVVSLPEPLPRHKLPVLFVLGGLGTGAQNIRYLPDAGDNAVVGYDWPVPVRLDGGLALLRQLPGLYRRVMTIPAQVSSAMFWIAGQPWADDKSFSLLGFSLGALAAPAVEDLAEHGGQPIGWTVLGYGGAPLGALVQANPHIRPGFLRLLLAPAVDTLLGPLEPTRHLPRLTGAFLVLEGRDDTLIPAAARTRFELAVPEPKTVKTFDGDHMGVGADKLPLLQQIIETSKLWLIDQGAIQPF